MFSAAALTPLDYFREILGGSDEDWVMALDSPFESSNLCLSAADNVSTKYNDREESVAKITKLLLSFISKKTGNYIIYFPSYKYMHDVFEEFTKNYLNL